MSGLGIEGYRDYLTRRDGDADLLHRRLASREEFFAGLEAEPVRSTRRIDRAVFMRNLRHRRPERVSTAKTLFLLATAKLNQAERFGVDLGDTYGRIGGENEPPERVYLALEEHYHTRLLAYVLDMFGLPFQVVVPPLVMRQFVKINVFLPERLGFAFVGAAEMAGCICSTSCAVSGSSCSPTNQTWPRGSSGSTARFLPTRWVMSATAQRVARRRSERLCVGFTRVSGGCSPARLPRSACWSIARSFAPGSTNLSTSSSSPLVCRTRRSWPHTP